jgi:hypothetical protein
MITFVAALTQIAVKIDLQRHRRFLGEVSCCLVAVLKQRSCETWSDPKS